MLELVDDDVEVIRRVCRATQTPAAPYCEDYDSLRLSAADRARNC